MNKPEASPLVAPLADEMRVPEAEVGLTLLLTWIGLGKLRVASITVAGALAALGWAYALTPIYTARTSVLPPASQQQGGSSAALAALGGLGALGASLGGKSPDELYVALIRSDSVLHALDDRYDLKSRYKARSFEGLRQAAPKRVRVASDRKSGVISIEVDDRDPKFAAELANAHVAEVVKVLARLAVSEAQQRRMFFEQQLKETKERLVTAEADLRDVQEKSGFIVFDRQAEALITGAAQVRALIADREVRLKVLRTGATEQNADVMRLSSELSALKSELSRMESTQGGSPGSTVDIPVGKIPAAGLDYLRARRELKLQETLLEAMVRQFELAKLDEAKEGPVLQQIDKALPPDYKSKPSRAIIVITGTLLAFIAAVVWVLGRGYAALVGEQGDPAQQAWAGVRRAWRLRR